MNPVDVVRQRERAGTLQSAAFKIAREAEQAAHDAYKLTVYKQQVDFDMAWTRLRDAWQEAKYSRDQQAIELAAEKGRDQGRKAGQIAREIDIHVAEDFGVAAEPGALQSSATAFLIEVLHADIIVLVGELVSNFEGVVR